MVFVLLRRFLLLFIPIYKITAERKSRFLSKTGVRKGKYRNPEDSGRNMQPSPKAPRSNPDPGWNPDCVSDVIFHLAIQTTIEDVGSIESSGLRTTILI